MKVAFNPNFVKDLRKLDKALQERVAAAIKGIEAAETLSDIPNVKKISTLLSNSHRQLPSWRLLRIGRSRVAAISPSQGRLPKLPLSR
jgi:mRNA-degrading endonuclease RelE of RelBE toxin-antitoxin system